MATILTRRIEAGRGLETEQGYVIYASVDGTTIDIGSDNKITLLPVDTEHIQNNAVTTEKIDDNAITTAKIDSEAVTLAKVESLLRRRYESQYYSWSEETGIIPCFMILPNEKLQKIYLASKNCYVDSSDYWNIRVYRWSNGDNNWTLLVDSVALTGETVWQFNTELTPNYTATQKTIIGFSFVATGNAPSNANCQVLAEIEKQV